MTNDCWAPSFWHSDYNDYFEPDIPEDEPDQCEECKKSTRKKLREENKKLKKENKGYEKLTTKLKAALEKEKNEAEWYKFSIEKKYEKLTAELKTALEKEKNEAERYKFYFEHDLELDTSCHVCKKPLHKKSCPFCIPTGRKRKRVK